MSTTSIKVSVEAPVMEVFASIQGEGLYAGEPQVLLRLRGCPLRCRWCDTPGSWRIQDSDRARVAKSGGAARREDPWVTPFQAACWIAEVEPGAPRTISITGGEPLLWPDFLLGLKPMVGQRRLHLETAGAHPRTLARVIDAFDHVSLDLKPDLDLDPPEELTADPHTRADPPTAHAAPPSAAHAAPSDERSPVSRAEWSRARLACLTVVRGRDACAKIVVSGDRAPEDFVPLLDEVESAAPEIIVFLQPATPVGGVLAPTRESLEIVCEMARDRDLRVRVVPQIHKVLGLS